MNDNTAQLAAQLVQRAREEVQRQNPAGAEEFLLRAISLEPQNPKHPAMLASVFLRQSRHSLAMVYAQMAVALAPQSDNYHRILGAILEGAGERDLAREAFLAAVKLDGGQIRSWLALARLEREAGRLVDAESYARKAIDLAPDSAEALAELGRVVHARGRPKEAVALFDRAIAAVPNEGAYHFARGAALADLTQYRDALAAIELALQYTPDQPAWLVMLARLQTALGRKQDAERLMKRAQAIDPLQAREFRRQLETPLGIQKTPSAPAPAAQPQAASMAPALQALETAVAGGRGDASTYQQLSLAYAKVGKIQEALAASREAEALRRRQRPG